jgi:GTP cyclohydrolase II
MTAHSVPPIRTDIVIACCRDEEDIIDAFIDFYLDAGFDLVCLVDNGSKDKTLERIFAHPGRDRVRLLVDSRVGYDKRLLEYYRHFAGEATGWVFFIDVDELIVVPDGIKAFAASLPPSVTSLRLPVAEMFPDVATTGHPLLSRRREARFQRETKVVWRGDCDVTAIASGKHSVDVSPRCEYEDGRLFVRHYHTRSPAQFAQKLANRIQTEESFTPGERTSMSVFTAPQQSAWLEESRTLLRPDGWERECCRMANTDAVDDTVIHDWWTSRRTARELQCSDLVELRFGGTVWQCFAIGNRDMREGHTAEGHLVLVNAPGRTLTAWNHAIFDGHDAVCTRIHSECLFGDVFHGDTCDCGWQLADAIKQIEARGAGVIIYLRQEGRGIGLLEKIRSLGVAHPDSFVRNERIGRPGDSRGYSLAGQVLRGLGVRSAELMSGNPQKVAALKDAGIDVCDLDARVPTVLSNEAGQEVLAKMRRGYSYVGTGFESNVL